MVLIEGRDHDLGGGFEVRRILPNVRKRSVGPFVFLDHMGPFVAQAEQNTDVRPHPHIGLSTLTYLFEGSIFHKDSLGSEQLIVPGEVNWMTAGRGVTHSERTPERLKHHARQMHGLQFWVALPENLEECEPAFSHYDQKVIPQTETDDMRINLVAGNAFGLTSPVKVTSPMLFAELAAKRTRTFTLFEDAFEIGIYVIEGTLEISGTQLPQHQMIVFEPKTEIGQKLEIQAQAGTRFIVIGGPPFAQPRHIWWNFVSSSKDKIEAAKRKWRNGLFDRVPGEVEFIPLPE